MTPDERAQALCRGKTDLFFPPQADKPTDDRGVSRAVLKAEEEAKKLCKACPVRHPCMDDVRTRPGDYEHGVVAGTDERQRRTWRRMGSRSATCALDGCDNRFPVTDGAGRPRLYCSDPCRYVASRHYLVGQTA